MRVRKINNFDTVPPKKTAFQWQTPPDVPKQPGLQIWSARRGGGKSVSAASYVKKLMDVGACQRVIIVTPTWNSNREIFAALSIADTDVLPPEKGALQEAVKRVEDEKREHDQYLDKKKRYASFQRLLKDAPTIESISPMLLLEAHEQGWFHSPPKWKHADASHPAYVHLIIDDCLSLPVMSHPSAGLVNLCCKHRHIADGLGVSISMLVQTYCAVGGLARPIRENCTLLCLGKLKDQNQRAKIHEEIGSDIEMAKFDEYFKYATDQPYGFLVIDFAPKSPEQTFRANFNRYLS